MQEKIMTIFETFAETYHLNVTHDQEGQPIIVRR